MEKRLLKIGGASGVALSLFGFSLCTYKIKNQSKEVKTAAYIESLLENVSFTELGNEYFRKDYENLFQFYNNLINDPEIFGELDEKRKYEFFQKGLALSGLVSLVCFAGSLKPQDLNLFTHELN